MQNNFKNILLIKAQQLNFKYLKTDAHNLLYPWTLHRKAGPTPTCLRREVLWRDDATSFLQTNVLPQPVAVAQQWCVWNKSPKAAPEEGPHASDARGAWPWMFSNLSAGNRFVFSFVCVHVFVLLICTPLSGSPGSAAFLTALFPTVLSDGQNGVDMCFWTSYFSCNNQQYLVLANVWRQHNTSL